MKEPWCLAASDPEATAAVLVNHYAKRWTIEPAFRDTKDLRFGMGLSSTRIGEPTRRDRLLLISAFAIGAIDPAGGCWREPGNGPAAQIQHQQNPHSFPIPPKDACFTS